MTLVLAYGGFDFTSQSSDVIRTLGHFMPIVCLALIAYVPASAAAQFSPRWRVLGLVVFIVIFGAVATKLVVMGEFGPAHVALDIGVWAFPLFALLLLIKTLALILQDRRHQIRIAAANGDARGPT